MAEKQTYSEFLGFARRVILYASFCAVFQVQHSNVEWRIQRIKLLVVLKLRYSHIYIYIYINIHDIAKSPVKNKYSVLWFYWNPKLYVSFLCEIFIVFLFPLKVTGNCPIFSPTHHWTLTQKLSDTFCEVSLNIRLAKFSTTSLSSFGDLGFLSFSQSRCKTKSPSGLSLNIFAVWDNAANYSLVTHCSVGKWVFQIR